MKKFTDAITGAWKLITHRHKGLPPIHIVTPTEEAKPDAAEVKVKAKTEIEVTAKKPHRKHKSSKHRTKPATLPVEVAENSATVLAVQVVEREPIIACVEETKKDIANSTPQSEAIDPGPRTKISPVVLMFGEKDTTKAEHASNLIEKRQSRELIFSGEGIDRYGLNGQQLPTNPHRLEVTSTGLHYLTTQEAVDEMNLNKSGPRGKVAPQYRV